MENLGKAARLRNPQWTRNLEYTKGGDLSFFAPRFAWATKDSLRPSQIHFDINHFQRLIKLACQLTFVGHSQLRSAKAEPPKGRRLEPMAGIEPATYSLPSMPPTPKMQKCTCLLTKIIICRSAGWRTGRPVLCRKWSKVYYWKTTAM